MADAQDSEGNLLASDMENTIDQVPVVNPRPAKRPRVLVACQRCKSRRQKCDNSSPACSNCHRANVTCTYTTAHAYPSSYVKKLEERVRQLEADGARHSSVQPHVAGNVHSSSASAETTTCRPVEEVGEVAAGGLALGLGVLSSCAAAEPHYFGFSAGLSLAHFVQVAIDSNGNSTDISLPLLADRPFSKQSPKANAASADPPSFQIGAVYLRAYITLVHPLYPFLNIEKLWKLHGDITKPTGAQSETSAETIDLTILHLVYAVGSRCLQLLGKNQISSMVPEGHFLRAMENIDQDLKYTSTKSIEVTLLLAIHSMRSPYGTSVWHLTGLAIRQCLELGLHKQRVVDHHHAEIDQSRKRLFWSAYIFERKTALVLGRPFALADEEIELDLPALVTQDGAEDCSGPPQQQNPHQQPLQRTSLSFHMYHVQLYQIHTQIRLALHHIRRTNSEEQSRSTTSGLLDQLDRWRDNVISTFHESPTHKSVPQRPPSYSSDEQDMSSSDEMYLPQIHDRPVDVEKSELLLEYHKARRSLLQPLMTESRHNYHFETADYAACAEASGQICQLYRRLHRLSPVPFTLRDLHAVFVAGFTLIYCVCTCPAIYSAERVSDVGACSTVLYVITEQWSSAKKYRDAFETIAEKMMDSARRFQPENSMATGALKVARHHRSAGVEHSGGEFVNPSTMKQPGRATFGHTPCSSIEGYENAENMSYRAANADGVDQSGTTSSLLSASGLLESEGLGLELDSEFSDIGKLLSLEGLDWFTGAVL